MVHLFRPKGVDDMPGEMNIIVPVTDQELERLTRPPCAHTPKTRRVLMSAVQSKGKGGMSR